MIEQTLTELFLEDSPLPDMDELETRAAPRETVDLRRENAHLKKQLARQAEELKQARKEALEATKLKSQFMANISHELRTPMSGVLGMAELLKDMPLTADQQELVSYIYTSANGLVEVVNGLLDFSRLQSGRLTLERQEFSPAALLDSIHKAYADTAHLKGLAFEIKQPKHMPSVLIADGGRIKQVLSGIVSNAIKFSERGTVSITLNISEPQDNVVKLKFSVKDDGIGIAKEDQEAIFTPLFQLDGSNTRKYGGVGLGLPICSELVKMMSGSIGVRSKRNQGSTFSFSVPAEVKS